jgi:autotransporter-associated beta strand protein
MLKQVIFGQSATQTGTLNLNGGTLTIGSGGLTALATPAAQINLGGGTLGAYAPWSTALPINLTNINGGATIDTTGGAITLTGILSGIGGFTKAGAGTLTLTRTNTYSGPTLINSGTLALGTGAASIGTPRFELLGGAFLDATAPGLRLAPGQELKGSGTVLGTVIADTGATITPGNSIGTLTLDTLILTNGPALRFELGATNNSDIVVVNSTLTLEGMVTNWFVLTATNGFDVGTYTLFQASLIVGQLGAETNFTSVGDSGMPGYLFLDGNNVRLEVIPEPGAGMLVAAGLLATLLLRRRRA